MKTQRIVVFGFGAQGRAQALNLRDSGCQVSVALYPESASLKIARELGFTVFEDSAAAAKTADIAVLLIPDDAQKYLYETALHDNLRQNATLVFAHGFNICFQLITPRADLDVILVAPKSPGPLVRTEFESGNSVPCLYAVHQDVSGDASQNALAYAHAIGCRQVLIASNFVEETVANLFSEQTLLSGGITELMRACFDTLTAAGYAPEVAYLECLDKLRYFTSTWLDEGLAALYDKISPAAAYGDLTRGPQIIDASVRERLHQTLRAVESGAFAREYLAESANGFPRLQELKKAAAAHPIEAAGRVRQTNEK